MKCINQLSLYIEKAEKFTLILCQLGWFIIAVLYILSIVYDVSSGIFNGIWIFYLISQAIYKLLLYARTKNKFDLIIPVLCSVFIVVLIVII